MSNILNELSDVYIGKIFLATSSDGEDGFKTFEVAGKIVDVPGKHHENIFERYIYRALKVTHYHKHKPPIGLIFFNSNDTISNDAVDLVNFFGQEDIHEYVSDY